MRFLTLVLLAALSRFDGPADNRPESVRPVPPPGVAVSDSDSAEISQGIESLGKQIESLKSSKFPLVSELLPDVQIFHNAARYALQYNEFFNAREIPIAKALLKTGMERAEQLKAGRTPWAEQSGLVVRGYRSRIDGSIQPYGLVVPPTYSPTTDYRFRLDCWFHGRGETLSELNFLNDRMRNPGEFTPPNTIVLHLYGRYCNANKLAGEIDLFEALESVKKRYPIDENRIAVRGFSMGGAACWQFAVHYPGDWAAAAPGAGFSETADFLKVFQKEDVKPTWYEQKLWHVYDCTDYALNLFNLPTVAYSGEKDNQKQAADMMAKACAAEGIELTHIIGPGAGHSYEAGAKREVNRRIDAIMAAGRNPVPTRIRFTTWTLRYNRCRWLTLEGLDKHWERARIDADITGPSSISIKTTNVSALTLSMAAGECPLDITLRPVVILDGNRVVCAAPQSDRSWTVHFKKSGGKWAAVSTLDEPEIRKRPGLQGPIDDAFMDSFLMVRPTGYAMAPMPETWVTKEMAHAIDHWRKQFRGEAPVKNDTEVTDEDIASSNLILWGDPSSNKILARIAPKLPIKWHVDGIQAGGKNYNSANHVPVLICPNPLNPKKYVVLNSGFTFREYDYLNNARQVPKLPDWAIVDISKPVTSRAPGEIVNAGFFDEKWTLGR